MQVFWLIFIYFLTGLIINYQSLSPVRKKQNYRFSSTKTLFLTFFIGLGGVMIADWLSEGNPLWPALGLISGVAGAMFPVGGRLEQSFQKALAVYFGGAFYLKPVIALIGVSIALEGLFWSKDRSLTAILFSSILPVLFNLTQVNPFFLWASVIIQLLFVIEFKEEIQSKIGNFVKTHKDREELDKL